MMSLGNDEINAKSELRREMRARLKTLPQSSLNAWSDQLIHHLQNLRDLWEKPGTIALFGGLRCEPDLISTFLPWLRERGWRAVFFKVSGTELWPVEIQSINDLRRGAMNVWEPVGTHALPLSSLDVILVPALAYSLSNGARLGRGGGFYDRLLSRPEVRARLIGIAFQIQLMPEVPCESHDSRVPELITELG